MTSLLSPDKCLNVFHINEPQDKNIFLGSVDQRSIWRKDAVQVLCFMFGEPVNWLQRIKVKLQQRIPTQALKGPQTLLNTALVVCIFQANSFGHIMPEIREREITIAIFFNLFFFRCAFSKKLI